MGDSRGGFVTGREVATPPVLSQRSGPEPGLFEGIYAKARERDTQSIRDAQVTDAEQGAIRDVAAQLIAAGVDPASLRRENWAEAAADRVRGTWSVERVLAAAAARRARDAKAFAGLETDVTKFRGKIAAPIDARYADVLDTASRATGTQALIGGLWGAAAEPENVGTMGLTAGGTSIAQVVVRNMVLQARVEAVSAVPRAIDMAKRGEEVTTGGMLADAGLAIVGTGLLEGAGRVIELGMRPVTAALKQRWNALPEAVRQRWAKPEDVTEADMPDLAEAIIGKGNLTEDEAAAVSVLRREADVAAGNPFVPDGAGVAAHAEGLEAAMSRILSDAPPVPRETRPPVSRGQLRSGTSMQGGPAALHSAIEANETGVGRSEVARQQLRSSTGAVGVMQVMPATGPEAARLAGVPWDAARFHNDPQYNRALGKAYYDKQLADFGAADKAAAAYNAGPGRLRAALRKAAKEGNPDGWLDYMPAETREYVRKFRDRTGAEASAGGAVPDAGAPDQFEALNRELADLERENVALDAGGSMADRIARDGAEADPAQAAMPEMDAPPPPGPPPTLKPEFTAYTPPPAKALPTRTRPSDVIEYLADRGGIRDDQGHDLRHGRGFHRVFVPRAGPLLRPRGMTIDAAGELLHEAGFFSDRPTTTEVLDMLDSAVNQDRKFYAFGDTETMAARNEAMARAEAEGELDALAMDLSLDMASERELIEDIAARVAAGEDRSWAYEAAVMARIDNTLDRVDASAGDSGYDWIPGLDDISPGAARAEAGDAAASGGGRAAGAGAAPGGGAAGRTSGADRTEQGGDDAELIVKAAAEFADPHGPAAKAQTESLEHDAQMDAFGGAAPADVRASLERHGAGRMKGVVAQKPPGSDGGLFDVRGEDMTFRFGDDDAVTTREMIARLDDEEAAIRLVEGCVPPAKPGDGGDV